jgi:hypothetical protein
MGKKEIRKGRRDGGRKKERNIQGAKKLQRSNFTFSL